MKMKIDKNNDKNEIIYFLKYWTLSHIKLKVSKLKFFGFY